MAKKGAANKESKKNEGKKKNKLIEGMFELLIVWHGMVPASSYRRMILTRRPCWC
jgi:hypothetical protein